jgi:putative nucleotidyltransferase with HDIG domain
MKQEHKNAELRKRAEEHYRKNGVAPDVLGSDTDLQRVVQELTIHQIELQMQNEELQESRDEIMKQQQRYADLYDGSPVGYLTLAPDSTILEANIPAARLLSLERSQLKGVRFGSLLAQQELPAFNSMIDQVFKNRTAEHRELMIGTTGCRLDAISSAKAHECHLTLTDITDQLQLRTFENAILASHQETIYALAFMVEARDPYTAGHQKRVAELSIALGLELHLTASEREGLRLSAILHDIGKFNIPSAILNKPTPLQEPEKDILRHHAQAGYEVLKGIHFPWPIAQTVLQHHERLDGSGYPHKLTGASIIKEAKIIGIADTVEAMTGSRPYRTAIGIDRALQHIKQESGRLFDPDIVELCIKLFQEKKFTFSARPASETMITTEGGQAKLHQSL